MVKHSTEVNENSKRNFFTPWIISRNFDFIFILSPPFVISIFVICFPSIFSTSSGVLPSWAWLVFILGIDVAHVYGTLFRTYFVKSQARGDLDIKLIVIPVCCWCLGVFIYSFGADLFWRCLAYLAVFHFIRQAYGFMRIYSRHDELKKWEYWVCGLAIYAVTVYPVIYWHLHLPRSFSWFTDGDFFNFATAYSQHTGSAFERIGLFFYISILTVFVLNEIRRWRLNHGINLGRLAIVIGNAMAWYLGIIAFNSDFVFTATNVVAHGVPYLALTWSYWISLKSNSKISIFSESNKMLEKKWQFNFLNLRWKSLILKACSVSVFLIIVVGLAYMEEGLWSAFVWREHMSVFIWADRVDRIANEATLTWLVPLLALPQATHYVLDAFIWKIKNRGSEWKSLLS